MRPYLLPIILLGASSAFAGGGQEHVRALEKEKSMTVQNTENVADFTGNGVTVSFPVGFKFNSASDLVVLLIDTSTGAASTLALNSDYTVSGAGDEDGGSVDLLISAPTSAQRLRVIRTIDIVQLTELRNQGKFYAETHEDAFDRMIMIDQQQQTEIERGLRVPSSDFAPGELPPAEMRAGRLFSFDSEGNPSTAAPVSESATELAIRLADPAAPTNGAGMVGYNPATEYPAGTAGACLNDFALPGGAGDIGFSLSEDYPANTVGDALKNPAGFSYKRAPSPYQAESGLVIGDQRYSAATIGAGSILLGGWNTAVNQYNRLPGTRNLRMILGGYDNEITAGTSGDDGGLACIIVGSHHSKILDAATHATVVGGSNHNMRGDFSAFVGGTLSEGVVGADFALTTGLRAKNRWGGSHTMGMGFSAAGDMQTVRATLRATSTSATAVEMQTTSASTSRLSLVDNSAMVFDIMVVGRRTDDGTEAAAYHIRGAVKRGVGAASVALIGTPTITVLGEDDASWNVNVAVSTSSGVLQVLVYGAAGKTIRWGGRIDMAEVAF